MNECNQLILKRLEMRVAEAESRSDQLIAQRERSDAQQAKPKGNYRIKNM